MVQKGSKLWFLARNRLRVVRESTKEKAIAALWARNGLKPGAEGYKIAETTAIYSAPSGGGSEVVEYRLYKLIDASVVKISMGVDAKIEDGVNNLRENNR